MENERFIHASRPINVFALILASLPLLFISVATRTGTPLDYFCTSG